jgi:hypothetical protein
MAAGACCSRGQPFDLLLCPSFLCSELLPVVANLRKANETKQSIAERLREQDGQLQQSRTRAKDLEKRLMDMKDAARTGDPADILKRLEEGSPSSSPNFCLGQLFADVEALRDKSTKALPSQIKAKKERLHRVRPDSCPSFEQVFNYFDSGASYPRHGCERSGSQGAAAEHVSACIRDRKP